MSDDLPRNIIAFRASDIAPMEREIHDAYGYWRLDRELLTITLSAESGSHYDYEIDLEKLPTSGAMLDMICQIAGKTWATPDIIGTLVMALDDIFYPQANLCSFGKQTTIRNLGTFLRKRLSRSPPPEANVMRRW